MGVIRATIRHSVSSFFSRKCTDNFTVKVIDTHIFRVTKFNQFAEI
jgi:hypothetical protein